MMKKRVKATELAANDIDKSPAINPNPITSLIIADLALRAGTALLRRGVEKGIVSNGHVAKKAPGLIKGRTIIESFVGTAVVRIATRSVPGAIIVGGGLLAKTLYDRKHRAKRQAIDAVTAENQPKRSKKS